MNSMLPVEDYSNFAWRRWSARVIDMAIGLLILSIVVMAFSFAFFRVAGDLVRQGQLSAEWLQAALQWVQTNESVINLATGSLAWLLDSAFYAIFKTTPGKKLAGILVIDLSSGESVSPLTYFQRDLNVLVRGLWLGLPLLWLGACWRQNTRVYSFGHSTYDFGKSYAAWVSRPKRRDDKYLWIVAIGALGASHAAVQAIVRLIAK